MYLCTYLCMCMRGDYGAFYVFTLGVDLYVYIGAGMCLCVYRVWITYRCGSPRLGYRVKKEDV